MSAGFQRMDLSAAVNQALSKPDDTDVFVRPPKPQATATARDQETSRDNGNRLSTANLPPQIVGGSDDSLRSFGMESDYYEDATIGSAPTSTPGPQARQRTSKTSTRTQKDAPEERVSQPARTGRLRPIYQPSDDEEEEEDPRRTNVVADHGRKINTPAPNRTRQTRSSQLAARNAAPEEDQEEESVDEEATGSEEEAEVSNASRAKASRATAARATANRANVNRVNPNRPPRDEFEETFEQPKGTLRQRPQHWSDKGGLFARAGEINKKVTSFDKANEIPNDPRERDFLIQQEIREVEDQVAREREEREAMARMNAHRETWKQWFQQQVAWVLSFWPFRLFIRQPINQEDVDEHEQLLDDHQPAPMEWWRLFHPMTYFRTLEWMAEALMDYIFNFVDRVSGVQLRGSQAAMTIYFTLLSLLALLLGGAVITMGMGASGTSFPDFPDLEPSSGLHWPSPSGLFEKIGSMVPSMPSWGRDDGPDIWDEPEERGSGWAAKLLDEYKKAVGSLNEKGNLHEQAIKKLESILPHIVHMDVQGGKPIISQEFWHALRDLLKADGSFLNLDQTNGTFEVSSDGQWQALLGRLMEDHPWTTTTVDNNNDNSNNNHDSTVVADQVESKLSGWWDRWVKNNDNKIQELVNKAWDKRESAGSERDFDERLAKIVNEKLKEQNQAVVSREEFLKHVESEFSKHREQITAEMTELRTKMDERVKKLIRAATLDAPKQVTKTEISDLVHKIVKKALADLSLHAVAKGEIKVNWDAVLKNQVNFFGVGSGATIDQRRTTPVWDPWNRGVASDEAYEKGILGIHPLPPIAALHPWQDEGDCFCGARTVNHRGNAHSASIAVHLAHLMIPQQVVIEHILPGATTDPDARPRHIEVWARIEAEEREQVRDFSHMHFPDNKDDWNFTPPSFEDSFVKISQFVYESDDSHNGVHIHHLSPELEDLGAMTDHVIIRAVSNYGDPSHTCFYRLRLFGKRID